MALSSVTLYLVDSANLAANVKAAGETGAASTAIAYFEKTAPGVTSVSQLTNDPRLLTVALGAFGLQADVPDKALVTQMLESNPSDSNSLVSQMASPQWTAFVNAFGFLSGQSKGSMSQSFIEGIVSNYQNSQYQQQVGQENPAVQNALYFAQNAGGITSYDQIIADPTINKVIEGAFGLPTSVGGLDPSVQSQVLQTAGLQLSQLSNPKYVQQLALQYLAMYDAENNTDTGTGSLASLFQLPSNQPTSIDLSSLDPNLPASGAPTGSLLSLFV